MSKTIDLERWKGELLTRPDEQFFDLMRSALGEIQTPFNKHSLLKKLVSFLNRRETKDRMLSTVSETDSVLLTAIYTLSSPGVATLYSFLKESIRYLDLHNHLLNLEERLFIYRSGEDGEERLWFNPIIEQELVSYAVDTDLVFESIESAPADPRWIRDGLLLSIIAYLREKPSIFTAAGKLKSRVRQDLERRFSFPDFSEPAGRVGLVIKALHGCGVIDLVNGEAEVLLERLDDFGSLSGILRAAFLAGGLASMMVDGDEEDSQRESARPSLVPYTAAAAFLLKNLPHDRAYPVTAFKRMLLAAGLRYHTDDPTEKLIEAMHQMGLVSKDGDYFVMRASGEPEDDKAKTAKTVVQPNFEVTLAGPFRFSDGIGLALGSELRLYDTYPVFEITREAVTRRFTDGESAAAYTANLEKTSAAKLPSNVMVTLNSWENEFLSIRIFSGNVLLVDEERRYLVEHSEELKKLIASTPAPGVYLIRSSNRQEIEKALRSCGIDQKPAIESAADAKREPFEGYRIPLMGNAPVRLHSHSGREKPSIHLREELYGKLDSMNLTDDVRKDLAHMIDKGLVLFPRQLEHQANVPREKHEAKGFDYVGKVRIIEQALLRRDLFLEITTRTPDGNSAKYLVQAVELKKTGSDLDLICRILPDKRDIQFRVRSMSLVRSVRGALFSI